MVEKEKIIFDFRGGGYLVSFFYHVCFVNYSDNRCKSYLCCCMYSIWSQQWQGVHCEVESEESETYYQSKIIYEPEVASVDGDSPT